MNLSVRDPMSIRALFRKRHFIAVLILAGTFLTVVAIFSAASYFLPHPNIPLMILGDFLAGLSAYYVYVRYDRQPLLVRCEACSGSIECRTPWICGQCGHENWNVDKFPFIRHCEKCHIAPKSYVCHHLDEGQPCKAHIFFSEDHDTSNPASRIIKEGLEIKKRLEKQAKVERSFEGKKRNLHEEFENKKQEVESAKLDLVLEQIKAQIKVAKKGYTEADVESALDLYFEAIKKFMAADGALEKAVEKFRSIVNEELKDNKPRRERANKKIDAWYAREFEKLTKNPPRK